MELPAALYRRTMLSSFLRKIVKHFQIAISLVRVGFHCSSAAPVLHGTWLHAAERRGSSDTRHSRYRDRARRFLMTFSLPARA